MATGTLHFLGRSSAFGTKGNTSAYFIEEIEGMSVFNLIDCGYDVFDKLRNKFDFSKFDVIRVYITHLHPDHAGSLGQFIFYIYYLYHKHVKVISNCEKIEKYLKHCGVTKEHYGLWVSTSEVLTTHAPEIDSYGYFITVEKSQKTILYTGDTNTLKPFEDEVLKRGGWSNVDEFYVEASYYGGVHLNIAENLSSLLKIQEAGTKVYLMHLDDEEAISKITGGKLEFVEVEE